ncbi:glutamine amidotransferase-related protein [Caulobacter segnis]
MPANTSAEDILARNPDGVLLSNGPGDLAATGAYAVPEIQKPVQSGKPVFGICLGHQMLALALGAKTAEDGTGPPRRQPPGQGPDHRQGRDRLDEPRLHRGSRPACPPPCRRPTSRCSTAPTPASS